MFERKNPKSLYCSLLLDKKDPSKNILYFLDDPGHSGSMLNYEQARKQAFKLAFILNGIGSPLIIGE